MNAKLKSKRGQAPKRGLAPFGFARRAGMAVPLFSIYSKKSLGIGELPDLEMLADWCKVSGLSMIQLLPMNDVGFNFCPYDAQSAFALEPMYLSLGRLPAAWTQPFQKKIAALKKQFPAGRPRVNYGIKKAKLKLLWEIFRSRDTKKGTAFTQFLKKAAYWLEDYIHFKVLKEKFSEAGWESWPAEFRDPKPELLKRLNQEEKERLEFHRWLQWQLYEQFCAVKKSCAKRSVLLMGDIPFLAARDSADVWAHQEYFKMHLAAGAPPDAYIAKGQRWGMPPYDWPKIAAKGYDYLREKLRYAENFYNLFRIDHVVGMFRLWMIDLAEPLENGGLNGCFDPADERLWEDHGRKLLSVMMKSTKMLPTAEDLGVIPECCTRILDELNIPGLDAGRWTKDWEKTYDFKAPAGFRKNSVAVLSTHDMSSLRGWWEVEAGTVDGALFERKCTSRGISFEVVKPRLFDLRKSFHGRLRWLGKIDSTSRLCEILGRPEAELKDFVDLYRGSYGEKQKYWKYLGAGGTFQEKSSVEFVRRALEKNMSSVSIFSIQFLTDLLSLSKKWKEDPWKFRINFPGTVNHKNWSLVMPMSLEEMVKLEMNEAIKKMNLKTKRYQVLFDPYPPEDACPPDGRRGSVLLRGGKVPGTF